MGALQAAGQDKGQIISTISMLIVVETTNIFLNLLACFFGKALFSLQRDSSRRLSSLQDPSSGKLGVSSSSGLEAVQLSSVCSVPELGTGATMDERSFGG